MADDNTSLSNRKLCGFCGSEIEHSENFCSKKCLELDNISESIQKINYCVELLKDGNDTKSDNKNSEIVELLEKYSFNISENIMSIRNQSI